MSEWVDVTGENYWINYWITYGTGDDTTIEYHPAQFVGGQWVWLSSYQSRAFFFNVPGQTDIVVEQVRFTFSPGAPAVDWSRVSIYQSEIGDGVRPTYDSSYVLGAVSPTTISLDNGGQIFWGVELDQRYNAGFVTKIEILTADTVPVCVPVYLYTQLPFSSSAQYYLDHDDWSRSSAADWDAYFQSDWSEIETTTTTITYVGPEDTTGRTLYLVFNLDRSGAAPGTVTINGEEFVVDAETKYSLSFAMPDNQIVIVATPKTFCDITAIYFCGEIAATGTRFWTNFVGQSEKCP